LLFRSFTLEIPTLLKWGVLFFEVHSLLTHPQLRLLGVCWKYHHWCLFVYLQSHSYCVLMIVFSRLVWLHHVIWGEVLATQYHSIEIIIRTHQVSSGWQSLIPIEALPFLLHLRAMLSSSFTLFLLIFFEWTPSSYDSDLILFFFLFLPFIEDSQNILLVVTVWDASLDFISVKDGRHPRLVLAVTYSSRFSYLIQCYRVFSSDFTISIV